MFSRLFGTKTKPSKADQGIGYDGDFFPQRTDELIMRIEAFLERLEAEQRDATPRTEAAKTEVFKSLKAKDIDFATDLACYCFDDICQHFYDIREIEPNRGARYRKHLGLFKGLARKPLNIEPEVLVTWISMMLDITERSKNVSKSPQKIQDFTNLTYWPLSQVIQIIMKAAKKKPLNQIQIDAVRSLLEREQLSPDYPWFDPKVLRVRINEILELTQKDAHADEVEPYLATGGDNFGLAIESSLESLSDTDTQNWHKLMHLAATAVGSKPTKKFMTKAEVLTAGVGKEKLRSILQTMLNFGVSAQTYQQEWRVGSGEYASHGYTDVVFTKENANLLKGLVWVAMGFQDSKNVNLIADLCEKSMKKLPGIGPVAQATASACLLYLEETPGAEATTRLSRLSTAIKQKNMQDRVAKIVERKAQAAGITTIQLQERIVPDYSLVGGEKTVPFDEYALRTSVEGVGSVTQTWLKPDGSIQKTKPRFVTQSAAHKASLAKAKNEVAALKKVLTAQRDRIDRLFAEDVEWPIDEVERYYVQHALVGAIANRLIWSLQIGNNSIAAMWSGEGWHNIAGRAIPTNTDTKARLWHPVECDTDEVLAWRDRLADLEIIQPVKQAYREVYLLTDAERSTRTYSNRMAAHMLKQHQMATLMAARGWRYSLMGAYDDGKDDQWAYKTFATNDLKAEYLLHTNYDDENWNDAGIYLYVGTDQLRFVKDGTVLDLETIPSRLLSETMRETDLFVGVASVGNDPLWADQGPTPEARQYWHSYSFGELDGFADTRKQVLEALLPRLKIRDVAHIEGKYLIVDGKLNTYKIHLGSSNILMAPGDRYLCIVASSVSQKTDLVLPFEGDNRLSVILSKALMLADDDKITASDIVRQLK